MRRVRQGDEIGMRKCVNVRNAAVKVGKHAEEREVEIEQRHRNKSNRCKRNDKTNKERSKERRVAPRGTKYNERG